MTRKYLIINREKHIVLDEIDYKGHNIKIVRKFGSYEFCVVDNKWSFGGIAEAKKFVRTL